MSLALFNPCHTPCLDPPCPCLAPQEPNTDEDLNISDSVDGGINEVSREARVNAITATINRQMLDVIEGQFNRVRLDTGRQKNVDEVWDTIKSGQ